MAENAKTNKVKTISTKVINGDLSNKIYTIRGQKVMLDSDLAEIYGYTTKALNQQVQRNREKFDEDFMFQLSREEVERILMCQNGTSSLEDSARLENLKSQFVTSSWGGVRKMPYVFTEQGIYMLMTVLRGELATRQSKMLIRLFKNMKDYISENKLLLDNRESLSIAAKVMDNSDKISAAKEKIEKIDLKVNKLATEMNEVVRRTEISPVFLDFAKTVEHKEYLLFEGEPIQAKEAYLEIYKQARNRIYIIDNYIDIRTLHLLQIVKQNMEIILFTDNARNYLRRIDLEDFRTERPDLDIKLIKAGSKIHDRYIILDERKAYQSGSSSKDAGAKMTSIHEIMDDFIVKSLLEKVRGMMGNKEVRLR